MTSIWQIFKTALKQWVVDSGKWTGYGLLFSLLLTACGGVAPVVKVGLVAPFEGAQREVGYDVIYSARLAVREINAQGGIGGYRVALVALDDSGNEELAQQTAVALTLDPAVVAVVGHWDAATTTAVTPIYAQAHLPFLPHNAHTGEATDLPATFLQAYTAVTPFDEQPGPNAGPAYATFQTLWQAMAQAARDTGHIDRTAVQAALENVAP